MFADRLAKAGIEKPTAIQAEVFPSLRSGQSVLGLSKTGTGKTFAFLCPLVQRLEENKPAESVGIRSIAMVPTRELAYQVARDLDTLAAGQQSATVVVGGEAEEKQIQSSRSAGWLIATPGRLLDLLRRRMIDVSAVEAVVFDEADRLLDMGFVDDIRAIMKLLPPKLQMAFFSATLHFGVEEMAYEFGVEFIRFGQEEEQATVEGLVHKVAFVGDDEKLHALAAFIKDQGAARGIVFSNYRDRAHGLSSRLRGLGCEAASLTAQLAQSARMRIMDGFRAGKVQVLIASDVASRGLDVFDIDYVVNYDLPEDPAVYVHRVGRTARAGRKGNALSFVGFEDSFRLERLEKFLGKPIERHQFELEVLQGKLPRFGDRLPDIEGDEAPPSRFERQGRNDGPRRQGQDRPRRDHGDGPRAQAKGPRSDGPRHDSRPRYESPKPATHAPRTEPASSAQVHARKSTPMVSPPLSMWGKIQAFFVGIFAGSQTKGLGTNGSRRAGTSASGLAAAGPVSGSSGASTGRSGSRRGGRGRSHGAPSTGSAASSSSSSSGSSSRGGRRGGGRGRR